MQDCHVRWAHKDTKMDSCGCGQGSMENTYVQDPEFGATPRSLKFSAFLQVEGLEILSVMISGYNLTACKSQSHFIGLQRVCISLSCQ